MDHKIGFRSALAFAAFVGMSGPAFSAPLDLSDTPLFLTTSAPPLNLLVMGRDHKLYYEAYNDASDLNNDGTLDVGYKPTEIDYYGYFDSRKCYTYGSGKFTPSGSAGTNKTCSGQWSGDFLNYLTTSRIDALRKVFYGGKRSTDSTTETVLERSHIPQDAHSWGKEYTSVAVNGYNISAYSPLSVPTSGTRHLFANTTLAGSTAPLLRVLRNRSERIWQWVSKEKPVAGGSLADSSGSLITVTPTDYTVRVDVCVSGLLEDNCKAYTSGGTTVNKPTGLLHDYGETNRMMFGLLTGSYRHNTQGGVMRKDISSFTNEVNPSTGQFTNTAGIVRTLDRLITAGFRNDHIYEPGWSGAWITTRPINDGEINMWGNPVAEMMFEGLRYFAGLSPTSAFSSGATGSIDSTLNLPNLASWANPYATYPRCSKPFMTVVSDINPSYDTDYLPGVASTFGTGTTSDLPATLNVSSIGDLIWNAEIGGSRSVFIGQSGNTYDGAPTSKTVTSFGNIRGLAPEEPTKNGGYYAASVAHHGLVTDASSTAGNQNVNTFAVALASPLPKIEINLSGRTITLVPFAKSVGANNCSPLTINGAQGQFQPTNQIVDFYVESLTSTSGVFRINFEDVEQGADHDMDAIVEYRYTVNPFANTVNVTLTSLYAAGCIIQHAGYVVSGSTADGVYLEVRDLDTAAGSDVDYFLDTPNVAGTALPTTATRTFSPGTGGAALALKDPLWYAAKWGGFKDANGNARPDQASEWDQDNNGSPDNYFLVTNPLNLKAQMQSSFNEILNRVSSFSNIVLNSGSLNANSALFQARFNSQDWSGDLLAYPINAQGQVNTTAGAERWNSAVKLNTQAPTARKILTYNPAKTTARGGIAFQWAALTAAQQAALNAGDGRGSERLDYLRGSAADEGTASNDFRPRPRTKLGDIVNSSPFFVGKPAFNHPENLEPSASYRDFKVAYAARTPVVYVGANDGMLHAFNACTSTTQPGCSDASLHGTEIFAYVPSVVYGNMATLTNQNYAHRYLVDGNPTAVDAFVGGAWRTVLMSGLRKGGRAVFALDVTDPTAADESSPAATVMWEFTSDDDADLGFTFSQPSIIKTYDGRWAAVIGNGYNNTGTGRAVLFVLFLDGPGTDGVWDLNTDYVKIVAGTAGTLTTPNGLATPFAADTNGDRKTDFVYAGDLLGNLHRFDIRSSTASNWTVNANRKIIFTARGPGNTVQPITTRPVVGLHPTGLGGFMVYFGTGKYVENGDNNAANQTTQTFYGVWDNGNTTPTRADLVAQTVDIGSTARYRIMTDNPVTYTNQNNSPRGWYFDLPIQGERVVTDPKLLDDRVVFSTQIPSSDPCVYGGTGWLMQLATDNGGRLDEPVFDADNDGQITVNDVINGSPPSGESQDSGMPTELKIIPGSDGAGGGGPCYGLVGLSDGEIKTIAQECLNNIRGSWRQLR